MDPKKPGDYFRPKPIIHKSLFRHVITQYFESNEYDFTTMCISDYYGIFRGTKYEHSNIPVNDNQSGNSPFFEHGISDINQYFSFAQKAEYRPGWRHHNSLCLPDAPIELILETLADTEFVESYGQTHLSKENFEQLTDDQKSLLVLSHKQFDYRYDSTKKHMPARLEWLL